MVQPVKKQNSPGRPRSKPLDDAILSATIKLIGELGYTESSLEKIAEEANSTRAAIYRRWPSKADVVVAAVAWVFSKRIPEVPDTGDSREDVCVLLKGFLDLLRHDNMHMVIVNLIPFLQRDEDLSKTFRTAVEIDRRLYLTKAIERGKQRDEISKYVDSDLCIDKLLGAIYFRLIFLEGIPEDDFIDQLVRTEI